jgi:hypothetical protein
MVCGVRDVCGVCMVCVACVVCVSVTAKLCVAEIGCDVRKNFVLSGNEKVGGKNVMKF